MTPPYFRGVLPPGPLTLLPPGVAGGVVPRAMIRHGVPWTGPRTGVRAPVCGGVRAPGGMVSLMVSSGGPPKGPPMRPGMDGGGPSGGLVGLAGAPGAYGSGPVGVRLPVGVRFPVGVRLPVGIRFMIGVRAPVGVRFPVGVRLPTGRWFPNGARLPVGVVGREPLGLLHCVGPGPSSGMLGRAN